MDDLLKRLGQRIRDLRTQRGWSQEDAAWHLRVHRTYMGHLERGEKNISFGTLQNLSAGLGITMSELLAGLETGEAGPKSGRNAGVTAALDRNRILRELEVLERTVTTLKEIASPPGAGSPESSRRKPGGRKS